MIFLKNMMNEVKMSKCQKAPTWTSHGPQIGERFWRRGRRLLCDYFNFWPVQVKRKVRNCVKRKNGEIFFGWKIRHVDNRWVGPHHTHCALETFHEIEMTADTLNNFLAECWNVEKIRKSRKVDGACNQDGGDHTNQGIIINDWRK